MNLSNQLRNELLAVVWSYSQKSKITVKQTRKAFELALEALGSNSIREYDPTGGPPGFESESELGNRFEKPVKVYGDPFVDGVKRNALGLLIDQPVTSDKDETGAVYDWESLLVDNERLQAQIERITTVFSALYDKWLGAGHRRDMNDAMESLASALGRPICPDCKCELITPGSECQMCGRTLS